MVRIIKAMLVVVALLVASAHATARESGVAGIWVAKNVTRTGSGEQPVKGTYLLGLSPNGSCAAGFEVDGEENGPLTKGRYRTDGANLKITWDAGGETEYAYTMPGANSLKLTRPGTSLTLARHEFVGERLVPVTYGPAPKSDGERVPAEKPQPSAGVSGRLVGASWVADLVSNDDGTHFTEFMEIGANGKCTVFGARKDGSLMYRVYGTYRLSGDRVTIHDQNGKVWVSFTVKFVNENSFIMHLENGSRLIYRRN
jgi:hypothetical protein